MIYFRYGYFQTHSFSTHTQLIRNSDAAMNNTKPCSVIIEKRILRSRVVEKPTDDVNSTVPEANYVPKKRQDRLKSVSVAQQSQMPQKSISDVSAAVPKASYVPGKRKRRADHTTAESTQASS